mmetsp:Transcript_8506/g.20170  ORF Transcript_8506/g.20170 Transcript_8506/m.20170 type:complete len:206 (-) Transcript_8506:339-956(-)
MQDEEEAAKGFHKGVPGNDAVRESPAVLVEANRRAVKEVRRVGARRALNLPRIWWRQDSCENCKREWSAFVDLLGTAESSNATVQHGLRLHCSRIGIPDGREAADHRRCALLLTGGRRLDDVEELYQRSLSNLHCGRPLPEAEHRDCAGSHRVPTDFLVLRSWPSTPRHGQGQVRESAGPGVLDVLADGPRLLRRRRNAWQALGL